MRGKMSSRTSNKSSCHQVANKSLLSISLSLCLETNAFIHLTAFQTLQTSALPHETFIFIIAARMTHLPIGRTPVTPTPPLRRRGRHPLTPLSHLLPPPPPPLALPTRSITTIYAPEHLRVCVPSLPAPSPCLSARPLPTAVLATAHPRSPTPFVRPLSRLTSTPTLNPAPCTYPNRPPYPTLRMQPRPKRMVPPFTSNPHSFFLVKICSWAPPNPSTPPYLFPLHGQPVSVAEREEPS